MKFHSLAESFLLWVEENRPEVAFNGGVSAGELDALRAIFPAVKDSDLQVWLTFCNGEDSRFSSLCGGLRRFLATEAIIELSQLFLREQLASEKRGVRARLSTDRLGIRAVEWSKGWVPFFMDNAVPFCVDFDPVEGGVIGQIICAPRGGDRVFYVCGSLGDFLVAIRNGLANGQKWPYSGLFLSR